MARRHVSDTPQYKSLLNCAHVTGAKIAIVSSRKSEMTEKDLMWIETVLKVETDLVLDAADPQFNREAVGKIQRAVNDLFVYAEADYNFDRVELTGV